MGIIAWIILADSGIIAKLIMPGVMVVDFS